MSAAAESAAAATRMSAECTLLAGGPRWLIDLLLADPPRAWRHESLVIAGDATRDDVAARLVVRTRELERHSGPRLEFVDWIVEADEALLRSLAEPGVPAELLAGLRRSASHAPRTFWPASLSVMPDRATIDRWSSRPGYPGAFAAQLATRATRTPETRWSDATIDSVAAELRLDSAELRALVGDRVPTPDESWAGVAGTLTASFARAGR